MSNNRLDSNEVARNSEVANSEDAALDKAITSIDPMLRASLQRDQKRRRTKYAIAGVLLMATLLLIVIAITTVINFDSPSVAAAPPKDNIQRAVEAGELTQLGWKQMSGGKLDKAEGTFRRAVKLDTGFDNAWNGIGWACFNQGKVDDALKAFEKCVAITKNHAAALNGIGQIRLSQRKYELAEKSFLLAKNASAAWYGLVRVYVLQGKFDEAAKYLAKLESAPGADSLPLAMFKKVITDKKIGDDVRSQIEPPAPALPETADALSARGWSLFNTGHPRAAELAFAKTLKLEPDHAGATNGMAFILLNRGEAKKAQPLFERLLKETPNHGGALNGLARCYVELGQTEKGTEIWKKLDKASASPNAGTSGLAMLYMKQKKYSSAIPLLRRLVASMPDNPGFREMLGNAEKLVEKSK